MRRWVGVLAVGFLAACGGGDDGDGGGAASPREELLVVLQREDGADFNATEAGCVADALLAEGVTDEDLEALATYQEGDERPDAVARAIDAQVTCAFGEPGVDDP